MKESENTFLLWDINTKYSQNLNNNKFETIYIIVSQIPFWKCYATSAKSKFLMKILQNEMLLYSWQLKPKTVVRVKMIRLGICTAKNVLETRSDIPSFTKVILKLK